MLQDMQNLQLWPRAARYNTVGHGLENHDINNEARDHDIISSTLRSVLSAWYQQYPQHPQFASFEFLAAAYRSFLFFSSFTTKHHSPWKQWGPITHWRSIRVYTRWTKSSLLVDFLLYLHCAILSSLLLYFYFSLSRSVNPVYKCYQTNFRN